MKAYIDESGITEIGQGKYFILTAFVIESDIAAVKCIKDLRRKAGKKYSKFSELKFHNSHPKLIADILNCIMKHKIIIYYVAYEKKPYNCSNLELKSKIFIKLLKQIQSDSSEEIQIVVDNFLTRKQQGEFIHLLKPILSHCTIRFVDSNLYPGIQIADFLSGALNRYYNHPDSDEGIEYFSIIHDKIVECR